MTRDQYLDTLQRLDIAKYEAEAEASREKMMAERANRERQEAMRDHMRQAIEQDKQAWKMPGFS